MVHIPFNDKCQNNDTNCHWKLPLSSCLPTDISVVYTALFNVKKMLDNIGQDVMKGFTHLVKKHNGKLFHNWIE